MSLCGRRTVIAAGVIALLAAMTGLSLSPPFSATSSAQGPTISLDPASAEIASDDTVDVSVIISNADNLFSASFHLSFDPNILEVVDADPDHQGVQVSPGNFPGPWEQPGTVQSNSVDNLQGTVSYDFTLVDGATPVSGSGTLAQIRFHGIGAGTSGLTFDTENLWGPTSGQPIGVTSSDGSLTVAAATSPTDTPTTARTATRTPAATSTTAATATHSPTRTPNPTSTPRPTATPRDTATAKPPMSQPQATLAASGAAGAQATPGGGLPSAGTGDLPSQIWRWFYLSGAVILGLATWAFTFRFYARQKESERFWHR